MAIGAAEIYYWSMDPADLERVPAVVTHAGSQHGALSWRHTHTHTHTHTHREREREREREGRLLLAGTIFVQSDVTAG